MALVSMMYPGVQYDKFDSLYDTLARFKTATYSVKASHPTIDCKVELIPKLKQIKVQIKSEPDILGQVIGDYIDVAGRPLFVEAHDNYDLVDRVLQPSGHTLKRKFDGFVSGKWIVPLPTNQ